MRLTADLINNSLDYINPLNERELDLRGHKIPMIENLGVAKSPECIDFTDNDISVIGNFPLSPRLRTLMLARNRVSAIHPTLPNQAPNLTAIILTQNQVSELGDLEPLSGLKKLTTLVLIDNPVTSKGNYRYWLLFLCPSLRFVDFHKVKEAERVTAATLFGTLQEPSDLAKQILANKSRTTLDASAEPMTGVNGAGGRQDRIKLTEKEKEKVAELVKNAKSLKEIERLEKMMMEGKIPGVDVEMGGM